MLFMKMISNAKASPLHDIETQGKIISDELEGVASNTTTAVGTTNFNGMSAFNPLSNNNNNSNYNLFAV